MITIKRITILAICSIVITIGLAACSTDVIEMPEVTSLNYSDAKAILDECNLTNVEKIKEDGSNANIIVTDNWVVLTQNPEPKTEVTRSTKITLTVKKISEIEAEEKKQIEEQEQAEEAELQNQLDSLKGGSYMNAYEKLSEMGYKISWIHSTSNQDFTETVEASIKNPDPEWDLPWIIIDYKSLNKENKTITLLINTQENLDSLAAADAIEKALSEKLDVSYAWTAVKNYGDNEFPYGFKLHNWVGVLAETAEDENTWFLKATCDVTNAFGATAKDMICEARVIGTTDNPQVIHFLVY